MKNLKFISVLTILFFTSLLSGYSQTTQPKIKIKGISVTGIKISQSDYANLVLSERDSINIDYTVKTEDNQTGGYFFRINITNKDQQSSYTTNNQTVIYKYLPEGIYHLSISAFDPRLKWNSDTLFLAIRVNNHEKNLMDELLVLKKRLNAKDTLKFSSKILDNTFRIDWKSGLIGLGIGLIILVFFLLFRKKKTSKNGTVIEYDTYQEDNNSNHISGSGMADTNMVSMEEYDKLQKENAKLANEINVLRTQINNLSTRTNELVAQNKELKDQIDRLSKSKEETERLQQQKDDLFTVVIHDIKNPAALIKSLVDLLRSYDLNAQEQSEIIDNIFETSMKIVTLSQEVTKILSLESSSMMLNFEQADMNEIVADVYKRNSIAAHNKEIELLLDISPDIALVRMDAQKIDEIVENLLSNAIKFSHIGGKVKLTTRQEDGHIIVEISDNGLGLSEDDINRAFQRGARLSAQPTAGEPSSGFGLWIVKKLVENHHGKVWVKSKLGVGSTFAFSIPLEQPD